MPHINIFLRELLVDYNLWISWLIASKIMVQIAWEHCNIVVGIIGGLIGGLSCSDCSTGVTGFNIWSFIVA